jgi:hypothetical protein
VRSAQPLPVGFELGCGWSATQAFIIEARAAMLSWDVRGDLAAIAIQTHRNHQQL